MVSKFINLPVKKVFLAFHHRSQSATTATGCVKSHQIAEREIVNKKKFIAKKKRKHFHDTTRAVTQQFSSPPPTHPSAHYNKKIKNLLGHNTESNY